MDLCIFIKSQSPRAVLGLRSISMLKYKSGSFEPLIFLLVAEHLEDVVKVVILI